MQEPTYTVLFLCRENAGRSLMAESILNKLGHGRFEAYSAGIKPASQANATAMQILNECGYSTEHLRPKHYHVFLEDDAPIIDFVITLCEDSEDEVKLSAWDEMSSQTITAHWHFQDPSHAELGNESERDMYIRVEMELAQRIKLFISLPDEKLIKLANKEVRPI